MRKTSWRLAGPVALFCLGASYGSYYGFVGLSGNWLTLSLAVGFGALIVALIDIEGRGWIVPKPAVILGNATFSLYLWHWAVIPVTGRGKLYFGGHPELWRWWIVVTSIAVALVSYYVIERPLIDFSHRRSWR